MLKKIFLIGWDNIRGSIIEASYPEGEIIESQEITKYLATIQLLMKSPIIEIKDENRIIVIYGIQRTSKKVNYNFILAIIEDNDNILKNNLKVELNIKGKEILESSLDKRKKKFFDFTHSFSESKSRKIVFMGYPNSGKTTTKKFIFEKIKDEKLLMTSLSPTVAYETSFLDLIDLKLAIFDTSGQELDRWFESDEKILDFSDLIFYFFSIEDWISSPEKLKGDITRLINYFTKTKKKSQNIVIFCHKYDLISKFPEFDEKSLRQFVNSKEIPLFFTSVVNQGNQDIMLGTQLIVHKFSPFLQFFSNILDKIMQNVSFNPLYLIDNNYQFVFSFDYVKSIRIQELNLVKSYILNIVQDYEAKFHERGELFVITLQDKLKVLIILKISNFHGEMSYLVLKVNTYEDIKKFYENYSIYRNKFKGNYVEV